MSVHPWICSDCGASFARMEERMRHQCREGDERLARESLADDLSDPSVLEVPC